MAEGQEGAQACCAVEQEQGGEGQELCDDGEAGCSVGWGAGVESEDAGADSKDCGYGVPEHGVERFFLDGQITGEGGVVILRTAAEDVQTQCCEGEECGGGEGFVDGHNKILFHTVTYALAKRFVFVNTMAYGLV